MTKRPIDRISMKRRAVLRGGLAAGASALLHACGGGGGPAQEAAAVQPINAKGAADTPVSLASYGGTPGAGSGTLINAFSNAIADLGAAGGGQLIVPPGDYDFGDFSTATDIIVSNDISNVTISAYGARFRLRTTENVIPCLFCFSNPSNVTIAGASFTDLGFDPLVNWQGMYCAGADATRPSAGFSMVDCNVDGAVGLFQSQSSGRDRFLMNDINLHGTVRNAYYGAVLNYVGHNANVDLTCMNVRRGCIAYALNNASIRIKMVNDSAAYGSNGFISVICPGTSRGNVENVRISLDASGVLAHRALIHFYHQLDEADGFMRNIDATANVHDLQYGGVATDVFLFDHELDSMAIADITDRVWDRILLHGSIVGTVPGQVVSNPSQSASPCDIIIDRNLAAQATIQELPAYFRIGTS